MQKSFSVQPRTAESTGSVQHIAQSGVGLWVSLKNSSTICLYHTETFRHLQDINIASNVSRVLTARDVTQPQRTIHVTALMASRGLLWVGTNVGIALTVPLPRLEGVPIISGRANISYHAHFGSVLFFLNLQHKVMSDVAVPRPPLGARTRLSIQEESEQDLRDEKDKIALTKQYSEGALPPPVAPKLRSRNSSPLLRDRRRSREVPPSTLSARRVSKTLPRGFSMQNSAGGSTDCDVFGLYGELLNVRDYDCNSGELTRQSEELRRSDPELSTIPYRVSTLDRRVRMKTSRPRSLDMSSWSVGSRGSGQTTSSSEAGSERPSPCVSRNASFQSTATTSSSSSTTVSDPPRSSGASCADSSDQKDAPPQQESTPPKKKRLAKHEQPKTITTLMGGRGYINWRRTNLEKTKAPALAQINNSDAFLVIWEMKV